MSWLTIVRYLMVWYLTAQIITVAVLPLTVRVLRALPDRGYSFAKISGVLLVGVIYWLGFSYGLLRNERGGVWLALLLTGAVSWIVGWADIKNWWRTLRRDGRLGALFATELLFVLAFVGWALVRAYDPNVDHTEQPMDLMFMNSIWVSATYPPRDAWLAGYAIGYYYLGYWLLATVARLANTVPSIAYNLGQALWYGYLWIGSFGVVMNLLAWRFARPATMETMAEPTSSPRSRTPLISLVGGVLGGVAVAFVGNLQGILEWLYAQGVNVDALARWVDVRNFPESASQTGQWYIDFGWWWWRSSRVIEDVDLFGLHIEVIDEFPMFSYLLGDNHPHVLAMPIVLLVIALALNLLLLMTQSHGQAADTTDRDWRHWLPLDVADTVVYLVALGSLVFLNTWDFPPYWLLVVAVVLLGSGGAWRRTAIIGGVVVAGTVLLYLPYFLTAQSQAGGIIPNFFNPSRLPQFLVMFGSMLPALVGVILLGWQLARPKWRVVGWVAAPVLGLPVVFLVLSTTLSSTAWGQRALARLELPPDATTYVEIILQRWLSAPWTLLLVGLMLTLVMAVLVSILQKPLAAWSRSADVVFVMLLGATGLALVYAPEFVFLRDYFGSRMNTVFKFYYQGWLLFGLASAYLITVALNNLSRRFGAVQGVALVSLLLVIGCAIFPIAGVYSKTGGFSRSTPTFDSTAYVAQGVPDVMAAVAWVANNTTPDELVLEGMGGSYAAHHNRISTMTGRGTLLGWEGHEKQWRGEAYGQMAQGRKQAIEMIYRTATTREINEVLETWGIDYVFVGPAEIDMYGITPFRLEELAATMDTVFARGQVRIFRRREG